MQLGFIFVASALSIASSAQAVVVNICDAEEYFDEGKIITIAGSITDLISTPIVGSTKHAYYYSVYITDKVADCSIAIEPPITIQGTCSEGDQATATGTTRQDSLKFTQLHQATVICK